MHKNSGGGNPVFPTQWPKKFMKRTSPVENKPITLIVKVFLQKNLFTLHYC